MQIFLYSPDELSCLLKTFATKGIFVLHGNSYKGSCVESAINKSCVRAVKFTGFRSPPGYEEVCAAKSAFAGSDAGAILAVGGGSAIDTAKIVKLDNPKVPLIAVPTTAGSGSESTRFAVYYRNGEKQSVSDSFIIPEFVLLEPRVLSTLPLAQKRSTFADALCQAVEAWWSVKATEESRGYSRQAIELLLPNADAYFSNVPSALEAVMKGANCAGRAINISQTTAAHAMSYKITSKFNLPHGYAVALCLPSVWEYMNSAVERGSILEQTLDDIALALGFSCTLDAPGLLRKLFDSWGIVPPAGVTQNQITELSMTVNAQRLGNFPVAVNSRSMIKLYNNILKRLSRDI